jgi:hypothetical protein
MTDKALDKATLLEAARICESHIFSPGSTDDPWLRGANEACRRLAEILRDQAELAVPAAWDGVERRKEGGWVRVSERLPPSNTFVCVWVDSPYQGNGGHDQAMLLYGRWINMRYLDPLNVTHWMPLPAGPKEASEEAQAPRPVRARD